MASKSLIRHINQARVLRLLKEQGNISRAELARLLNLTRSTLTYATSELIEIGLITEAGQSSLVTLRRQPTDLVLD